MQMLFATGARSGFGVSSKRPGNIHFMDEIIIVHQLVHHENPPIIPMYEIQAPGSWIAYK